MYRVTLQLLLGIGLTVSALQIRAQSGLPLWTNLYGNPVSVYEQPNGLATDVSGNVLVTGLITETNNHDYAVTIKYSSAGVALWTNIFNGDNNADARAIAVNSNGDVFVTGYSTITGGASQFCTLAYSSAGVPLWTNHYAYGASPNYAVAMALDSNGNVVVAGTSFGGQLRYDYATVAYSGSGVGLWTNRYNGGSPVDLDAYASAVAADHNGNVFVTGYSVGNVSSYDYATIKYSGTGARLWVNRYNGPANGNDYARAIAVDTSGNVFVTGYSSGTNSGYDYATVGYSNIGTPLWTNRYDGPASGNDYATAIAADRAGNVFVTGYSSNSLSGYDFATVAYSNSGTPLWTNRYDCPVSGNDYANAIAVDSAGNVFVTGYSTNSESFYVFTTVAYSNGGVPLWTNVFAGPGGSSGATALAVDTSGNLYVTGNSYSAGQEYTTIKYSSSLPQPAVLDFQFSTGQMVLTWTNPGFALQAAPAVTDTFTNVPGATSPYTVSVSGPQQFFRLISN